MCGSCKAWAALRGGLGCTAGSLGEPWAGVGLPLAWRPAEFQACWYV